MRARLILSDPDGYVYIDEIVESVGTGSPSPAYLIRHVSERAIENLAKIAVAALYLQKPEQSA